MDSITITPLLPLIIEVLIGVFSRELKINFVPKILVAGVLLSTPNTHSINRDDVKSKFVV